MNSLFLADGYKTSHHSQYPKGTTKVYSNFTPRSLKHADKKCDKVVVFGIQLAIKQLHKHFQENFFSKPKEEVCGEIKKELSMYLGSDYDVTHFEALHDLGYLPIKIKALEEGSLVDIKIPVLTITNTLSEFFWVTNYLETIISNLLWKPMTSASIAFQYKKILTYWANLTDKENLGFVNFQAHDFSMRGLDSIDAAISSGLGHLTSFSGSDTLPVIPAAREYYNETGFVCASVDATEHSVMSAGGQETEKETYLRLIRNKPSGIISIVSDTWDLWSVVTELLPSIKDEIMARDGKTVIRPDTGLPEDIICGDANSSDVNEQKGLIELLWETFEGTTNAQGYKVLDSHIGAIYGDSITLDRAEIICKRLADKGFASTNVVLGVGSFTYQFNTRDTFGFAMKATYVEINGKGVNIFKNPKTDDGTKKSATGLLKITKTLSGEYQLQEKCSVQEEQDGELKEVYVDGKLVKETTLTNIKTLISNEL